MPADHCQPAPAPLGCAASKRLRAAPWRMCPPRAPVGAECVVFVDSYERRRRERERRASRARLLPLLMLAGMGGVHRGSR